MASKKSNNNFIEKSELKTFMANIRSGNLIQHIEYNQQQFEEQCNYLNQKLKQSEDEVQNKVLILEQNSHLIEKFQNKLKELSDQNTELLDQHQTLKCENEHLHSLLQLSEDKFAELDILYDQKLNDLCEKNEEVLQQLQAIENSKQDFFTQFDQNQTELKEKLSHAEKRIVNLENELSNCVLERTREADEFTEKLNGLSDILKQKTANYEERIKDLQARLTTALDSNHEIIKLKNQLENLNKERNDDQEEFHIEKTNLTNENLNLLDKIDNLEQILSNKDQINEEIKRKLLVKEKETEELYLKCKRITRTAKGINAMQNESFSSVKNLNRKHQASDDDPKPLDGYGSSSESDASSVSVYKFRKRRLVSTDYDDVFSQLKNNDENQFRAPIYSCKSRNLKVMDQVEIPESPVVSSSAFGK